MQTKLPQSHTTRRLMVGSKADKILLKESTKLQANTAELLLASISEITATVACVEFKDEIFISFGSFLYRASAVILELQMQNNFPANAVEKMKSISKSIGLVKNLAKRCVNWNHEIQTSELIDVMEDIEEVKRDVARGLNGIVSSLPGCKDYLEIAVKSLSKELKSDDVADSISMDFDLENQQSSSEEQSIKESALTEKDLYSIELDDSIASFPSLDTTNVSVANSPGSTNSRTFKNSKSFSGNSLMSLPELAQNMEPLYKTFICPLTNKIMDDPVTLESGVTYERKAITKWLGKFESLDDVLCPTSGQKLKSKKFRTNMALKETINAWQERNDVARIKVARAALSLASTDDMILEAVDDLLEISHKNEFNKVQIQRSEIVPLLAKLVDYKSRGVRCATLELLHQLADDDDGKESIANSIDPLKIIKMLSSSHQPVRHASALLLIELSKSKFFCDKVGEIAGGIPMLITIKYRDSTDEITSSRADEILKNLKKSPANIKNMAEFGYWEPLLNHLIEGSEEMQMEMAQYLSKITIEPGIQAYVAKRASPALIKMVHNGNSHSRCAAFNALRQVSSYQSNGNILVEAGIVQLMAEEMFSRTICDEPLNSNKAAGILANVLLGSGNELENLLVNVHGHTMSSDYIISNIIQRIKSTSLDDMNINLSRVLLGLMKFPKASATIVSVVRETEAIYNLIEIINNPNEELQVALIKLLIALSSFMGHSLCDRLCKTKGQLESLIQNPDKIVRITEKHAVCANFLAKLPHENLTLNHALINRNMVPKILETIHWIQRTGSRTSRYTSSYLEGLVGTLVRFTTTLYDFQVLSLVRGNKFTSLFAELLMKASSDEVQKLSAMGLENLSSQSVSLSRPPMRRSKSKYSKAPIFKKLFSNYSSEAEMSLLCPIHRGVCSSQDTFCLLDAKVVERLMTCLDHENIEVVKAALSALCTLLDDKVDVHMSIKVLQEMHAMKHVLRVIKEHKEETLLKKSFWVIDRFLMNSCEASVSVISSDSLFLATLINAFHHGDEGTRQIAEKILMHLNKMPTFSTSFTT